MLVGSIWNSCACVISHVSTWLASQCLFLPFFEPALGFFHDGPDCTAASPAVALLTSCACVISHVSTWLASQCLSSSQHLVPRRPSTRTLPQLVRPSPCSLARLPREVLQLYLPSMAPGSSLSRASGRRTIRTAYGETS